MQEIVQEMQDMQESLCPASVKSQKNQLAKGKNQNMGTHMQDMQESLCPAR